MRRPPAVHAVQPLPELAPGTVLQHYEELTFPPLAARLERRAPRGPWCGAVALGEGGPVGLAVAELPPEGAAQLVSLAVAPAARRRGLGGALVETVERLAGERGAALLEGAYRTSWRSRRAVEALLASRGWSSPETRLVLARGESATARALVRQEAPELPPEAELFGWGELAGGERRAILDSQQDDPWYPEVLTPFQEEPRLEPAVSVGLRWAGEVAGWLVVHRVAFDTVQYSAFFLRPDLRGRGLGRALVREAVRRRLADPAVRYAILAVDARNEGMLRLVDGPLRPFLPRRSELRVSRKALGG
jgi:ribosomal protein S18 acetylase RimI-like enzyme